MGRSRKLIELKVPFFPYTNEVDREIWELLKKIGRSQESKIAFIKGVLFALAMVNQGVQLHTEAPSQENKKKDEANLQEMSLEEAAEILGPLGRL